MTNVLSFILGGLLIFFFIDINTKEIKNVWQDIQTGVASHVEAKRKMVELYNAIYNTSYNPNTNCGSCLSACRDGIQKLYNKYNTE